MRDDPKLRSAVPGTRRLLIAGAVACLLAIPFLTVHLARAQETDPNDALPHPNDPLPRADDSLLPGQISDSLAFELLRQLAREDTLGLPPQIDFIYGRFVETKEKRPTVKEIVRWAIEHEEGRFEGVEDAAYTERARVIELYEPDNPDGRRRLTEHVERVYIDPNDEIIRVQLGERTWDSEDEEVNTELEVQIRSTRQELSRLPFFFEQLDDFDFQILERRILSDRILYKIGFEPRSDFKPLPEGWFLVDTQDYQIVRAEMALTENVPFPIILKAVDRVVMQRRKIGDVWIAERFNAVVTLREFPLIPVPARVEMEVTLEDVAINAGIPDSLRSR